jgi:hypothetical protein
MPAKTKSGGIGRWLYANTRRSWIPFAKLNKHGPLAAPHIKVISGGIAEIDVDGFKDLPRSLGTSILNVHVIEVLKPRA